jgi:pyrimidine operon attenuation protein/uracil phosphoribosyltransferase
MNSKQIKIRDKTAILYSIKRIAYQIYENNETEKELILAGIEKNGFLFAEKICKDIQLISSIKIILIKLSINKKAPLEKINSSLELINCKNKSILVLDDVLNTGSTLIHAVKFLLQVPVNKIQTAVLVNRNHKKFPIKADFKGISLSTSMKEHIHVVLEGKNQGVFLS